MPNQPRSMESKNKEVKLSRTCGSGSRSTSSAAANLRKPPTAGPSTHPTAPSSAPTSEYVYEEDEYDMNDVMSESEPSHDEQHVMSDGGEHSGSGSPNRNRRGKRKTSNQLSPKSAKKLRGKRAACWKHFKVVQVASKRESGKTVEKAKCRYCGSLFAYAQGGQTSSLNRHLPKCTPYMNLKGRQLAKEDPAVLHQQATASPSAAGSSQFLPSARLHGTIFMDGWNFHSCYALDLMLFAMFVTRLTSSLIGVPVLYPSKRSV